MSSTNELTSGIKFHNVRVDGAKIHYIRAGSGHTARMPNVVAEDTWDLFRVLLR